MAKYWTIITAKRGMLLTGGVSSVTSSKFESMELLNGYLAAIKDFDLEKIDTIQIKASGLDSAAILNSDSDGKRRLDAIQDAIDICLSKRKMFSSNNDVIWSKLDHAVKYLESVYAETLNEYLAS